MKHKKETYDFDALLKQSFLESKDQNNQEKAIEMNAQYIFKQPSTGISEAKLQELLSRHKGIETTVGFLRIPLKVWRFLLPVLFVGIGIYTLNQLLIKQPQNLLPTQAQNEPKSQFVPPIIAEDEKDSTQVHLEDVDETEAIDILESGVMTKGQSKVQNQAQNQVRESKSEAITTKKPRKTIKSHSIYSAPYGGSVKPKVRMSYPDLYQAPAPKFAMEASPEKYILKNIGMGLSGSAYLDINQRFYWINYYQGQPFNEGMDKYVYINKGEDYVKGRGYVQNMRGPDKGKFYINNNVIRLPDALMFYLDQYEISDNRADRFKLESLSKHLQDMILKPFYFSKYEVTNKEYTAFMDWVLESNGYQEKPYVLDTIPYARLMQWRKYNENVAKWRAYYIKWQADKAKAYKYTFFNPTAEVVQALKGNSLHIAPLDSIYQSNNNQFMFDYEINPLYGPNARNGLEERQDFPVVGISYYQALAYLDWKMHFHQTQLDSLGIPYTIEYRLPNRVERSLVYEEEGKSQKHWLTDLRLEAYEKDHLDKVVNEGLRYHLFRTGVLHTTSPRDRFFKYEMEKHQLKNGVSWLDGNASEWMADSYRNDWKPAYEGHRKMMLGSKIDQRSNLLAWKIEDFYNEANDTLGQLVMGGNYLDYRESFSRNSTFNKAGTSLKIFANPHQQYSTVGFRYIIRVKDAEEEAKETLMQFVGTEAYDKYKDFPENYIAQFKAFEEGKYILDKEVTNGMWRAFLIDLLAKGREAEALKCLPKSQNWADYNSRYIYYFKDLTYDDLPVVNISHEAVGIFNAWMTEKFNAYPLRKFGTVEFSLPSEAEWEKAAMGTQAAVSQYPWFDVGPVDAKGQTLANLTYSPYEHHILSYPSDADYRKAANVTNIPAVLEKQAIHDSLRLDYYEAYLLDQITYQDFQKQYTEDWMSKESFRLHHSEDQIKNLKKNKAIFMQRHVLTVGGLFPPNRTGLMGKNKSDGLYDMVGNVAEMIINPKKTKGGSWNTFANLAAVHRSEVWNGQASPMVGFRPVLKVLYEGFDHNINVKPSKTPPGVLLLNPNFGVDRTEVRNVDYREYMYYIQKRFSKESEEYKALQPDTSVWDYSNIFPEPKGRVYVIIDENGDTNKAENIHLQELYLHHPAYANYPLVGVTYEQAQAYCQWRSDRVNEYYAIYHAKNPDDKEMPKHMTYRLPTAEEWEQILKTDSIYKNGSYLHPNIKAKACEEKPLLTQMVDLCSPNSIGLYGLNDNVTEMCSGNASGKVKLKGEHWAQKYLKTQGKDVPYEQPESWIGFRCVVEVEY